MSNTNLPVESVQVLVVGAGPVGLFAGLCAARRGLDVLVVDQVWRGYARGHAALLHGSTLALLEEDGIAAQLRAAGRPIERVTLRVDGREACTLELPSPALAVPQNVVENALLEALRRRDIELRSPHQAAALEQHADYVDVRLMRRELVTLGSPAEYSDWEPIDSSLLRADYVIGADGYDSRVRGALGVEAVELGNTESFAMFEFEAHGDSGNAVQLCFDDGLGSAHVPLPGGRARWGFQLAEGLDAAADVNRLRQLLGERAPWYVDGTKCVEWGSVIQFERRLARRFGKGRVWLAGDAAHVTAPFGAHSMNAGLIEAHMLASRMAEALQRPGHHALLESYGVEREREWHKLLGVNVGFELLPHAPAWLSAYARKLVPALPASGAELTSLLERIGLRLS